MTAIQVAGPRPDDVAPAPAGRRRGPRRRDWSVSGGLVQLALAVVAFHVAVVVQLDGPQPSATVVALAYVLLVPGTVALRALGLRPRGVAPTLVYTVTASLALLLAALLGVNQLGPSRGIAEPLATGPVVLSLDAVTLLLAVVAVVRRTTRPMDVPRRVSPAGVVLVVPLVVAAGTQLVENRGTGMLVGVGLVAAGGVLLWALREARAGRDGHVVLALYCVALALMWSFSLRSRALYGFDVQQEFAAFRTTGEALRWTPLDGDPYSAMLSITALPTALWQATGLDPLLIYKALFPAVFALYPAAVYLLARQWLRPTVALLGTSLVFLTGTMASQMPALARQEIGLVLFAGMLLAAFDRSLGRRGAQQLVLLLGVAMVVSHYSTTYVAIGTLVAARIVALGMRLMRRSTRRPVISLPLTLLLAAWCVVWTGPVTNSASNVTSFAEDVSTNGAKVLPGGGDSFISKWLSGNVAVTATPRDYFDTVAPMYGVKYPWLADYTFSEGVQAQFPAVASAPPADRAVVPGLLAPMGLATTLLRQLSNGAIVIGVVGVLIMLRRRRLDSEVASLVVALLTVTVAVRFSGSASFAYNPERLAMQTSALLVVPLGIVVQRLHRILRGHRDGRRPRVGAGVAAALAVGVMGLVFLDASGLGARLAGGPARGNLTASGEYAERFHATDEDLAAAQWLTERRRDDSIIFADRYGALTLQFSEGRDHSGIFPDLAPGTLDTRGFVFASSSNILNGRARGTTPDNQMSSTYRFPTAFLDTYKAVVFDTGTARIY